MESVYIETSILSYLTARPSRNLIAAARQQLTAEWWEKHRFKYRLVSSNVVIAEASQGDADQAHTRLNIIRDIPILTITSECEYLAERLVADCIMPENSQNDALHLAISCYHSADFLMTWNCRHLANAHIIPKARRLIESSGYVFSQICTPEELMGE
ncbi:MAG: hypothetical protein BWK80_54985 [Desulfobacteraceae bacterium IS3]|nr:MAG: hypothetical protein BWK80_54985 [Desulfobacteraceae bacterium IS3]HAO19378.1 DNA-binding protein [Desulfobacteraceae bacterium]